MAKRSRTFNPKTFLTTEGEGREMMSFKKGQPIYAQGDPAATLFIIQTGKVKISVHQCGKDATLCLLGEEDFCRRRCAERAVPFGLCHGSVRLCCPPNYKADHAVSAGEAYEIGSRVLEICFGKEYPLPTRPGCPPLQPEREETGTPSFDALQLR